MKTFTVLMTVDDAELAEAHRLYAEEHNGRPAPSDLVAMAQDIQAFCYDDGGMHGSFEVVAVKDGGQGAAGGEERSQRKAIWIVKGRVTDAESHGGAAKVGDAEWQFSDGQPGDRGKSSDYLSLEEGLRDHAPALFHFIGDEPETLWCESCGEAPATRILEFASLCPGCADEAEKDERALVAQGPEGNGYDLPSCRACGYPGSDDHEDCPNCYVVTP
jgi:hypothetical protein